MPGSSSGGPDWGGEIGILIFTACYVAVILALTARRTPVAPATLAFGAAAGLMIGAVMYALAPVGLNFRYPYRPWLHNGWAASLCIAPAWILVFCAPLAAGVLASRRCHVTGDSGQVSVARAWQGFAAGLVSGGVGAVFVTVFGSGTTALLVRSAWLRGWLYHGQHLTATVVYGRELFATGNLVGYFALLVAFPVIGLMMGLTGAGIATTIRPLPDGGRPGGPPGPEPVPDPPDDSRLPDPGADQTGLPGRYDDGQGDQGTPLVGAGLERAL